MNVEVLQEKPANFEEYARIRLSFEVLEVLDVDAVNGGISGFSLSARKLRTPYVKDYDAVESPSQWANAFDTSNWGVFAARSESLRVGGAVVAFDTQGLTMLEDRRDIAVLWDIRVAAHIRGQGIGTALFRAAEEWAAARGCRKLKVETQNINAPACRFYVKQGCILGAIHRFAYPEFPDETQLLWYKDLPA